MSTSVPREALRAIFADLSGLPPSRVLWSNEPKGFAGPTESGASGHLILDCIATRRVGVDEELHDYEVEASPGVFVTRVTFSGQRLRTIQVRAENYEAQTGVDLLEDIRLSLGSDAVGERLNAASLSLNGDEDVRDIGGSAGNRAVSFATLDVLLNHFVSRVIDRNPVVGEDVDTFIEALEITEAEYET